MQTLAHDFMKDAVSIVFFGDPICGAACRGCVFLWGESEDGDVPFLRV